MPQCGTRFLLISGVFLGPAAQHLWSRTRWSTFLSMIKVSTNTSPVMRQVSPTFQIPTHRERGARPSKPALFFSFSAGLVTLSPEWNRRHAIENKIRRRTRRRKKTPPSHLCYCKQSAGGERIRALNFFCEWIRGRTELRLAHRESKQLLPARRGFPLHADGKPSQKKINKVSVKRDNNSKP